VFNLSEKWAPFFQSQPETGMGYEIVSAILNDGRRLDRVCVVGGAVTTVDGSPTVPFVEADIAAFIVTHDRGPARA
jgi:hypothetical protein